MNDPYTREKARKTFEKLMQTKIERFFVVVFCSKMIIKTQTNKHTKPYETFLFVANRIIFVLISNQFCFYYIQPEKQTALKFHHNRPLYCVDTNRKQDLIWKNNSLFYFIFLNFIIVFYLLSTIVLFNFSVRNYEFFLLFKKFFMLPQWRLHDNITNTPSNIRIFLLRKKLVYK